MNNNVENSITNLRLQRMYEAKAFFVQELGKLLALADSSIAYAQYEHTDDGYEWVHIYNTDGYHIAKINVHMDSHSAILKDVIKNLDL